MNPLQGFRALLCACRKLVFGARAASVVSADVPNTVDGIF